MFLYRLLKNNTELLFFISLMILVASLPVSRFGLSVGQFSILTIWIIDGRFKEKLRSLWANKPALVLISFYMMHVLGLIYTVDYDWALKDLRVKLPLLFLPVVFATFKPLSKERTNILLLVFISSVLVASLISLWIYLFKDVSNFRELSPFISHIRLSLNVCLAIFFGANFAFFVYARKTALSIFITLAIAWFFLFLIMIESITGIVIIIAGFYSMIIVSVFRFKHRVLKLLSIAAVIALPIFLVTYLSTTVNQFLKPHKNNLANLEEFTPYGQPYMHDTVHQPVENGSYVGLYVCDSELRSSWNQVSDLDYDGLDELGQPLKNTLVRYLNSKDLRKDSDGLKKLSNDDIRNIEKGIANVYYTNPFSLNSRIYKLLWEYQVSRLHGNPGGHSITQRLEFWRVSIAIIKDHFILGVGTGDIKEAYAVQYDRMNSQLEMRFRHRAHNQFLAISVSFGIAGLLWFLISLVYPGVKTGKLFKYRYFVFWITLILSMLVEDTLETQMGATLFAFFNAFLLFGTTDE